MYVILGASGHTGSSAARALLQMKQPVRVVLRDAAKGETWRSRGAEVALADLNDLEATARALTGAEGVYLLVPPHPMDDPDPAVTRRKQVDALVSAVRRAAPRHVVALSSVGAQHPSGTGPVADLHPLETGLSATGVPTTLLRAGYFMTNWAPSFGPALQTGKLHHALDPGLKIPMVAPGDVGREAAALLLDPAAAEAIPPGAGARVVEFGGPHDYSFSDAVEALTRVSGKEVHAVRIPAEDLVAAVTGMGASPTVAFLLGEMTAAINDGLIGWEGGRTEVRRGATTLEECFRGILAG